MFDITIEYHSTATVRFTEPTLADVLIFLEGYVGASDSIYQITIDALGRT